MKNPVLKAGQVWRIDGQDRLIKTANPGMKATTVEVSNPLFTPDVNISQSRFVDGDAQYLREWGGPGIQSFSPSSYQPIVAATEPAYTFPVTSDPTPSAPAPAKRSFLASLFGTLAMLVLAFVSLVGLGSIAAFCALAFGYISMDRVADAVQLAQDNANIWGSGLGLTGALASLRAARPFVVSYARSAFAEMVRSVVQN